MNKRFSLLRALSIICTILLSGGGLTAAGSDSLYVVVLNDSAGSAQPDIPALGGEVLHQSQNRRVVRISAAGIRALAAHRGVKYIQRVEVDGSLPPLPFAPRLAATAVATNASPAPTWYSGEYVYDGDGNITAIGTAANQASDGGSEAYTYDSATRLVQAVIDHGTTDSEKYTYDSFGNLVDTTRTASPSTATPASPATNRLTGVTYDAVGNTLSEGGSTSYVWDGVNMMRAKVKSTETALYVYTADDERIGAYENGEQRWMIRDLSNKVLREWIVLGGVWMWREDHIYRNGALAAGEREPAEGGTRHFHLDHLGTPRLITDANATRIAAHDYYPFGVEKTDFRQEMVDRGTSWPETMGFTGHERDYSGGTSNPNRNYLYYMHARHYNPVWGRFLTVDPVVDAKKAARAPQRWNRYAYVLNNPINAIDPDGRKVQVIGKTAEEQQKTFQLILSTLPPSERVHVRMDRNGVITVGTGAKGGIGFDKLKDLARNDVPLVRVHIAKTTREKVEPGPMARTKEVNLQRDGGGALIPPAISLSGDFEAYVDDRGSAFTGADGTAIMAHELMGHAWDLIFTGKSTEETAKDTENKMLGALGSGSFH